MDDNSELILLNFQNNQFGSGYLTILNGTNANVPYGLIWGSAFNRDKERSKLSSLYEAFRKLTYIQTQKFSDLSLEEFMKINYYNFSHHGKLSLHLDYASELLKQLIFSKDLNYENINEDFTFKVIDLSFLNSPPVKCVQVKNSNLQDLFLGQNNYTTINLSRIGLTLQEYNLFNIGNIPHPID